MSANQPTESGQGDPQVLESIEVPRWLARRLRDLSSVIGVPVHRIAEQWLGGLLRQDDFAELLNDNCEISDDQHIDLLCLIGRWDDPANLPPAGASR